MSKLDDATVALQESNTKLQAVKQQLVKIGTEIQALIAAAPPAGSTTPEFDAALAALQTTVGEVQTEAQADDDLNPDAPETPTP